MVVAHVRIKSTALVRGSKKDTFSVRTVYYYDTCTMLTFRSACTSKIHTGRILVARQLSAFRRYIDPIAIAETGRGGARGGA